MRDDQTMHIVWGHVLQERHLGRVHYLIERNKDHSAADGTDYQRQEIPVYVAMLGIAPTMLQSGNIRCDLLNGQGGEPMASAAARRAEPKRQPQIVARGETCSGGRGPEV